MLRLSQSLETESPLSRFWFQVTRNFILESFQLSDFNEMQSNVT